MNGAVLKSERLVCRPMRIEDAEALHQFYSDHQAMTWFSHPPYDKLEQTRAKIAAAIDHPEWRGWSITVEGDDRAIGTLAAHEKRQGGVIEIAYSLVRDHWGKGYAREAVTALIDQLFSEGHRKLFGDVDPDNLASRRLLESLGFQLEGILRDEWNTHIGVRDTALYGLLRKEWTCRDRT